MAPAIALIENRVQRIPFSGCWIWMGCVNKKGYGQVQVRPRTLLAHRLSYEAFVASIPPSNCVLHRCDVPACVNPDHLFLGSIAENNGDMFAKGRGKTPVGRGSENPMAVLRPEDVAEIRADSRRQKDIAADYGVSQAHVSRIKRGLAWR